MQNIFTFTLNSKLISFSKFKLSLLLNAIQKYLLCVNISMITMGHHTRLIYSEKSLSVNATKHIPKCLERSDEEASSQFYQSH